MGWSSSTGWNAEDGWGRAAAAVATSTLNPADKTAGTVLTNGNMTAGADVGQSGTFNGVRGTLGRSSGKHVFEFTMTATGDFWAVGVNKAAGSLTLPGLSDSNGATWCNDGRFFANASAVQTTGWYTPAFGTANMVAFDVGNLAIWVKKPGGDWNNSPANDPATNTGGIAVTGGAGSYFINVALRQGNPLPTCSVNLGGSAFTNTPPSGFSAWG